MERERGRNIVACVQPPALGTSSNLTKTNCFCVLIVNRKRKLRSSLSASERAELIKMKAQMEQEIQALREQIYLEERALIARSSKPQHLAKTVW